MKPEKSQSMMLENERVYSYIKALLLSFYSSNLYVDVGKRWKGFGLLYLLMIIVIFSTPIWYHTTMYMNQYYSDKIIEPLYKVPTIYIQNGEVQFDKKMPYFIRDKQGQVVLIIDTKADPKTYFSAFPQLTTVISKNSVFYTPPPSPFRMNQPQASQKSKIANVYETRLDEHTSQAFNGKDWVTHSSLYSLRYLILVVTPLSIIGFLYMVYVVLLAVAALFGQFVAQVFFSFNIKFKQSSRLMAVSSTPLTLFLFTSIASVLIFGFKIPYAGIIALALLAFYFNYAVFSLKRESQRMAIT